MNKPSIEQLRESLGYKDGLLFWKRRPSCAVKIGTKAGCVHKGRRCIKFKGAWMVYSRVVWVVVYGGWPDGVIDHINGDALDDRIENLRVTDLSGNSQNRTVHRRGQPIGVTYSKRDKVWLTRVPMKYLNWKCDRRISLGTFKTMGEAGDAVRKFCEAKEG